MAITIIRRTSWPGMGTKLAIKINGETISEVGEGQQVTVSLPSEMATLSVYQVPGSKSNTMDVREGETIEITSTTWSKIVTFLPGLAMFIPFFFFNSFREKMSVYILILVVIVAGLFLINSYHLKKI